MLFITYLLSDLLLYIYHFLQVGCIHYEIRFFPRLPPNHVSPYSFQGFCFSQLFGYPDLLVISLLSTRIIPFSKSLKLPSFFADSTRPTKSLFSRRSLYIMRSWESATPLSSVPFVGI